MFGDMDYQIRPYHQQIWRFHNYRTLTPTWAKLVLMNINKMNEC
jgi:hypothetical protein